MDQNLKTIFLRRILTRQFYVECPYKDEVYTVRFSDPSSDVLALADFEFKKNWNNNSEIPTLEETYELLKKRGNWSDKLEQELTQLTKDIDRMTLEVDGLKYHKTKQEQLIRLIAKAKDRREELFRRKMSLLHICRETVCNRIRRRFIISRCSTVLENQDIMEDHLFLDALSVCIDEEENRIDEKIIRELSRTHPFRIAWKACQESGNNLFQHPMSEMTDLQTALVSWAMIYDFAFNHTDRPSQEIIDNDDLFDQWYKSATSGIKKAAPKRTTNSPNGINEIYITCDPKSAKEVYELNDAEAKARIASRNQYLKEHGSAREEDLPDVKRHLRMQINQAGLRG